MLNKIKQGLILLLFCALSLGAYTQGIINILPDDPVEYNRSLPAFTAEDSLYFNNLPEVPVPDIYTSLQAPTLPAFVDNSTLPFFRPPFQQAGYCCGQASLIGYNFTYEINRRRGVSGAHADGQYATHFTWNFDNAANYYGGVSYFHSIEILREVGNPNCAVYGGMAAGGEYRWMSGYDNYYHAMQNRITTAYQLKVNTPEGLQTLKHWIHDHLEGSDYGGLASFYANQPWWPYMQQLPAGTPEEGKYVTLSWLSSTHSLCIVGYNDSIRWDYNEDGQYTNDIDINNDGVVDMKDWEIGGLKFVNSYGGVPNWADGGFCYMMYKTLAENYGSGGIWNNTVTLLDVKEEYIPQLTMKIYMKHNRRGCLKIRTGLATDTLAAGPEIYFDHSILNYQGHNRFMQGGTSEEDKYYEFGIDISSYLTYLEPDQEAKFFFSIIEDDPGNNGEGELLAFSLMDYTHGMQEIPCPSAQVPIADNDTTFLAITHAVDFNKVEVLNQTLPPAFEGEPYQVQLMAGNGSEPYFWDIDWTYQENAYSNAFPMVSQNALNPSSNDNAHVMVPLDFSFPYYDKTYDTVWMHTDGILQLEDDIFWWYYLINEELLFPRNIHIAPFFADLYLYQEVNDGMWYEGNAQSATFRWKASVNGQPGSELNFACRLYPSGIIDLCYGPMEYASNLQWASGISRGTCVDYQFSALSGNNVIPENHVVRFLPVDYPHEMELSDDGVFSGIPAQDYNGKEISFKATDNNFIFNTKTLILSNQGLLLEPHVLSGNDVLIEAGETAELSVKVINYLDHDLMDAQMTIVIPDTNFTLIDSTGFVGNLAVGDSAYLQEAFSFAVSTATPNETLLNIMTNVYDDQGSHPDNFFYTTYSPVIELQDVIIDDGLNSMLDPGETTDVVVSLVNCGVNEISDITLLLSCTDPYIELNDDTASISIILPDSTAMARFNLSASINTPVGHAAAFQMALSSGNNYENLYVFNITVGRYQERFETADFSLFPWGFDDDRDWQICSFDKFEGEYATRSAHITHNEESSLIIDVDVFEKGKISFFRKVSCEDDVNNDNYDYLAFSIDNVEQARWDGEVDWASVSYDVDEGYHRLKWTYHKDGSVSRGWDCAWVDYIIFPPAETIEHSFEFIPPAIEYYLKPNETGMDSVKILNTTEGTVAYEIFVTGADTFPVSSHTESILGSKLICTPECFRPGDTVAWEFRAYNASTDNEWFKDIYIDFPEGVMVDSMTRFIGGSGDMYHDYNTGNGVTVHWHGENSSGWGVVKGGQMAIATVYSIIDTAMTENISINFEIHGDIYGVDPHVIFGFIDRINLGMWPTWLSAEPLQGDILSFGQSATKLDFNSYGLTDSSYHAYLHLFDNFGSGYTLPVHLIVDSELYVPEHKHLHPFTCTAYPNPFNDLISLNLDCDKEIPVSLIIYDLFGHKIKTLLPRQKLSQGLHSFFWDGNTNRGFAAGRGVYLLVVQSQGSKLIKKLVYY